MSSRVVSSGVGLPMVGYRVRVISKASSVMELSWLDCCSRSLQSFMRFMVAHRWHIGWSACHLQGLLSHGVIMVRLLFKVSTVIDKVHCGPYGPGSIAV